MICRRLLGRFLPYFILVLAIADVANGAIQVHMDSVKFNVNSVEFPGNRNRIFAPRSDIEIACNANEYTYGSREYAYMVVAVVPTSERYTRVTSEQLDRWIIYGV